MKKDILFLCQFFYPERNTSATLPFDTAKFFVDKGMKVDVICGYPKEYCEKNNIPHKENVFGVGIKRIKYIQLSRKSKLGRLINYFSFTFAVMLQIMKFRKYKCVFVYSNPPILPVIPLVAKRIFHLDIVFVAYDIYPEVAYASKAIVEGGIIDRVMKTINKWLYRDVSQVVTLTDEMTEYLLQERDLLTKDRVTKIENWSHEKKGTKDNVAYEKFGYTENMFIVSYFGNMGICQEMNTLINAARELQHNKRIKFLFAGHGNKVPEIKKRIENEKISNIQICDFLSGDDFEQALAISSCCVVSLEKGLKGMCAPSKFYTYLQGGQVVIAITEKESYLQREIRENSIGYGIEIGDVSGLVNVLNNLSEDKKKCEEISKRSYLLYKDKYSMEIGQQKYYNMVMNVLRGKNENTNYK